MNFSAIVYCFKTEPAALLFEFGWRVNFLMLIASCLIAEQPTSNDENILFPHHSDRAYTRHILQSKLLQWENKVITITLLDIYLVDIVITRKKS